ncbi:GSCFA domain-containing protein [Roseococcus sp. SYP-B2431]|uniref:GSCFA domain-containing protein n=1 Tax=Roseococcus sp. SYP-B2431 TaxID=2496640 RepID=UPI0013F490B4|nr:GSCFA domain-containing protein [Roseococcus sp. SYP-B2431]
MNIISPYQGLPERSYWRSGVSRQSPDTVSDLYIKKFSLNPRDKIITAGSCFAQHISRQLRKRGCGIVDAEPAPPGLLEDQGHKYGYHLYSARYGNIYTVRQLLQLVREARGKFKPAEWIWEKDGRFFDALRPSVEPEGLRSAEEVVAHREIHLGRVRGMFARADVFIFTMGLTEAWQHRSSGTVFPTAPGTIAGQYDPVEYEFINFDYSDIYSDFIRVRRILKARRPDMRFLLTVSPVPLTATASGDHVLAATLYSKSVLRAVAGRLAQQFDDIDYFPSYDLIASHFSKAAFYEGNLRSVTSAGVEAAMRVFFAQHDMGAEPALRSTDAIAAVPEMDPANSLADVAVDDADDLVCEDALLEAFGR